MVISGQQPGYDPSESGGSLEFPLPRFKIAQKQVSSPSSMFTEVTLPGERLRVESRQPMQDGTGICSVIYTEL
jgi:hypothetical protein